jgi:putative Mg2+ transporter-C (MgtC) family protein
MNALLEELSLGLPDANGAARILLRTAAGIVLGAVLGRERQQTGKAAGIRTHILVALGAATFVLAPLEAGMPAADVSRIVQGIAAGIGFIGAGAILKVTEERQIQGLTTAASVWITASVGVTAGLGRYGLGLLIAVVGLVTLSLLGHRDNQSTDGEQ